MSSAIVGMDAAVEEFVGDPMSGPGTILLEIHAAVPSIDWGWLRWVPHRRGVPDWLTEAVLATCDSSTVELLALWPAHRGAHRHLARHKAGMACIRQFTGVRTQPCYSIPVDLAFAI